jgi:hypothetical protein
VSGEAFAGRTLTLHLDGAVVEQRETARKGYLEILIPPGSIKESLRIAPGKGVQLIRVVTTPQKPARNIEKELGQLAEREELLHDRLKALSVREDIFKSAAKSQSAKAPRRTKTNPEPLSAIKQGTDYAITQLETVYHAKRKAEKELAHIAERRLLLGKEELSGGTIARVWLTPPSGSVIASWVQPDRRWFPSYQVRVDDKGSALIALSAQRLTLAKGETAELVLAPLRSGSNSPRFRYENEWTALKREECKVVNTQETNSSPFTVSLINSSLLNLPAGEISCFKSGVYMGQGNFPGVDVGKSTEFVCSGK